MDTPTGDTAPVAEAQNGHEAHHHAQPRLIIGIAAVVLLAAAGFVWATWGEDIKEACFGEDGACPMPIEGVPLNPDGTPAFPVPDTNGFEETAPLEEAPAV